MAQAILLQDVPDLGERGTAVDVSPGYLRNFLIPRKLAQPATPGALEEAQRRMEAAERAAHAKDWRPERLNSTELDRQAAFQENPPRPSSSRASRATDRRDRL